MATSAERARAYRDRQRAAGKRASGRSGKSGKHKSLFDHGEFVGIDGEGFSEGEEIEIPSPSGGTYKGKAHYYALLSASDGSEIYEPSGRLTAQQCLDFLIDIRKRNKMAIIVCFGASYDFCQMLAYDLTREQIAQLMSKDDNNKRVEVTYGDYVYRLEYRARKQFSVWRWPINTPKYRRTDSGRLVKDNCESATVWDVWGFFQASYVEVMNKWLKGDPDFEFVQKMKGNRKLFDRTEIAEIRRYNLIEVETLARCMDRVRQAVAALGIKLTRWDGAGAVASAMCRAHNVKEHMQQSPDAVFTAACHAYSGGHIEVCRIGYHNGVVHHYDVNSAYPDQFRNLPSLAGAVWHRGTGKPPAGFTLVRVRYWFKNDMPFYPLFFREQNDGIIYPQKGEGWYWFPEYEAAENYAATLGAVQFDVIEWWHCKPTTNERPFVWVEGYYAARQQYIRAAKEGGYESGEEKVIKLGINALYGKTAQQAGARLSEDGDVIPPSYFQIEWAGYVTAGCRAKLMNAAIQKPRAIISFATDGIFSTEPLDLDCPKEKILGAWEYQTHAGITMVMPGVYWLHEDNGTSKHYSRGFDKDQMHGAEFIHQSWRQKKTRIALTLTRLIGLGSSHTSDIYWNFRGSFVEGARELALDGHNSKRCPISLHTYKPHLQLIDTYPREQPDQWAPAETYFSKRYEISWETKNVTSAPPVESDAPDYAALDLEYDDEWSADEA